MLYPFDFLDRKEESDRSILTDSEKCPERSQNRRTAGTHTLSRRQSASARPSDNSAESTIESQDESEKERVSMSNTANRRHLECKLCKSVQQHGEPLRRVPLYGELSEEHTEEHWISIVPCSTCQSIVGISVCGRTWTDEECLRTSNTNRNGILQVESYRDRLVLFVLSQVMFQQEESSPHTQDVTFLCPGPTEFGKIMWVHGEAAAFYTLKLKGSVYTSCSYMTYQMPVVDLVYVRPEFRRQGLASALVADVMATYTDENVGFSEPVSDAMLQVLGRYLEVHAHHRDHIWEVSWTGQEGFRNNIWLLIRRLRKEKRIK